MMDTKCEQCGFDKDSSQCHAFQREHGCHACDKKGCWTSSSTCVFRNRNREDHVDASLGDNVDHMRRTSIECFVDGIKVAHNARRRPNWWYGHDVEFHIDGKAFRMGIASGDGCNCLIDTIRQALDIECDVSEVRAHLELLHRTIIPGDFLELQHHWRSIINLLCHWRNIIGGAISSHVNEAHAMYSVICVDVLYLENGDVEGDGSERLYIARQNANHFVPLLPFIVEADELRAVAQRRRGKRQHRSTER